MSEGRSIHSLVSYARETDAETMARELGRLVLVGEIEQRPSRPDGWGSVTEPGTLGLMFNPLGSLLAATCLAPGPAAQVCIGRDAERAMRIVHPSVSALHARIEQSPDGAVRLSDQGSNNGTWVNGTRLAPGERAELAPGQDVRIGDVTLRVYDSVQLHGVLSKFNLE